jgi:hypothetical protein
VQLALADREQNGNQRYQRSGNRRYNHQSQEHDRRGKGGLLAGMPPELRQAALNLIDYQLTPILVDQWRYNPPLVRCMSIDFRPWSATNAFQQELSGQCSALNIHSS